MSTIKELESAVQRLSETKFVTFRNWFLEYDARQWDQQFQADAQAGRLDWLAEEARREAEDGHCTPR